MFHYHKKAGGRLNNFIELNYVRMAHYLQDVDFATDPLHVVNVRNFTFFEDLDGYLLIRKNMNSFLHFAKSTLAKRFSDSIAPYHNRFYPFCLRNLRLVWQVKFLCH